ncbi:arylsulfatase [Tamlana sp. 2201CG12-4]|uniref:sulfatase family protein n=1 Tax=Tamlana sp. 2201CG12-4 TaxID=3112582 RepID=UPI002DB76560|nr:arylsulfatase [Tamlana sp. 2201CG12-4]MEC3907220.1 arylsulfatase [Tamlana sp. 2201CG12-4]
MRSYLSNMIIMVAIIVGFGTDSYGQGNTKREARNKFPNIIFILADDLGYGDVSCLNPDSKIKTPNMDSMAKTGITFTDAHSSSSVCTPSRYSVLTGRYAWRTSLKSGVLTGYSPALIKNGRQTVASMLKKYDYHTAIIGKWHLGMGWETTDGRAPERFGSNVDFTKKITDGPTARGFDYYYGISASMDMPPYCLIENDRLIEQPNYEFKKGDENPFGRRGHTIKGRGPEFYLSEFTSKAVEKIGEYSKSKHPFFIYFPLNAPHTPIAPNKEFIGQSNAGDYGDFVVEVDNVLGRIITALEDNGIKENTLVIFTSDNGPETICYPRAKKYNHYSAGKLKGVKRDLWEGGHRVPFFVNWPLGIKSNIEFDETICLSDFYATVADIVGHKRAMNEGEDSFSFYDVLQGKKNNIRPYTIHHSARGNFAIRKGDWVLIDNKSGDDNNGRGEIYYKDLGYELIDSEGELYNLKDDLREFKNQYTNKPEIVKELKNILNASKLE